MNTNAESAGSAAAAAPVDVDGYNPMTDPKRRAKSNDPGWKFGYWTEIGNRDKVTCNLCKSVTTGGIKRLKEHLAGGYADTVMCSKTTTAIRKEMREYLEKHKRNRPIFIDDDSGEEQTQAEGDSTTVVQPSSGTAAKRRKAAFQFRVPASVAPPAAKPKVVSVRNMTP